MFTLTNYGVSWFAANPGQMPLLNRFRVGDGYGYTPALEQTALQGVSRYLGVPSRPRSISSGEIAYDLFMDLSVGNFNWGEVGLYLNGNLFGIGVYSTLMRKTKLTDSQPGNLVSMTLVMNPGQTTVISLLNNSDNELNLTQSISVDLLPPAQIAYPNISMVASPLDPQRSLVVIAGAMVWNVSGYEHQVYEGGVVSATANTVRIAGDLPDPEGDGDMIVHFTNGSAAGYVRVVESWDSVNKTMLLRTPLQVNPSVGDILLVSKWTQSVRDESVAQAAAHRDAAEQAAVASGTFADASELASAASLTHSETAGEHRVAASGFASTAETKATEAAASAVLAQSGATTVVGAVAATSADAAAALASANTASAAAVSASAEATEALGHKTGALAAKTAAQSSATSAAASSVAAAASEASALNHKIAAEGASTSAGISSTAAAASAATAVTKATESSSSSVAAVNAASVASDASVSAAASAATAEVNAAAGAGYIVQTANNAATAAAEALISTNAAVQAAASAVTASTEATTASVRATESANSASSSAGSAASATSSATEAGVQATAAAASATTATTQAGLASADRVLAQTAATNAASSEAAAELAATESGTARDGSVAALADTTALVVTATSLRDETQAARDVTITNAGNAAADAVTATTQAGVASTAATTATTKAGEAAASQAAAALSELVSETAAAAALTHSQTAGTHRTEASGFADQAASSASEAAASVVLSETSANTQRLLFKLRYETADADMLVVGDSTGNAELEWVYMLTQWLAAQFPAVTVKYHLWNDVSAGYDPEVIISTGTGLRTLTVWNASVGGTRPDYFLGSRYDLAVAALPRLDLLIVNHGHNLNGSISQDHEAMSFLELTEPILLDHPGTGVLMVAQNPERDTTDNDRVPAAVRDVCAMRGFGLIDAWREFTLRGKASYLYFDNIHPSTGLGVGEATTGTQLVRDTAIRHFTGRECAPFAAVSLLSQSYGVNLLENGNFASYSVSPGAPDGWTAVGSTVTKDTTIKFGTNQYSVKVEGTGVGVPLIRIDLTANVLAAYKGQWLVAAVATYTPASENISAARVTLADSVNTTNFHLPTTEGRDRWRWKFLPLKSSSAATYIRLLLSGNSASGSLGHAYFGAAIVRAGKLPTVV